MIKLQGTVTDTKLELTGKTSIQEYQLNSAEIRFTFDNSWNDYTKYVMFESYSGEQRLKQAIVGNVCTIPTNLENGFVKLQVYGEKLEGDKITQREPTNVVSIHIARSITPSDEKEYPQADEWDIYIKNLNDYAKQVEDYKQNVDNYKESTDSELSEIKSEQSSQSDLIAENESKMNQKFGQIDGSLSGQAYSINQNTANITNNKNAILSLESNSGSTIELSIDNSTYVITLELKNTKGEVISTQNIDLPLETMVVSADYKKDTKEIEITLQNGNKTSFSVADLIDGLVNTNTFETKIAEINNKINQNIKDISTIKEEQTTQNTNIQNNKNNIDKNKKAIEDLNNRYFLKVENIKEVELEN